MGIALAGAGVFHQQQAQRSKEAELLFVGDQFLRALASYYEKSPGGAHQFPQKLDDLLHDTRYPVPVRHLRRVYRDPMTGSTEWGLVQGPNKGITGIYSLSQRAPIKAAGFPEKYAEFEGAKSYWDWKFVYQPAAGGTQEAVGSQAGAAPTPLRPGARSR